MAFVCPRCSTASEDAVDQAEGFCPRCQAFTGERAHPAQRERLLREDGSPRAVWPVDWLRWEQDDAARGGHD